VKRYLLDTHTVLWFLQDAPELPDAVASRIEAEDAVNHVSMASIWEMAIKVSLGKLAVPYSLESDLPGILEESGFAMLNLSFHHLGSVARLPFHHRDPFDRVLIAQAQIEGLILLSRDPSFDAYGVTRIWE
jgi:PIN domain nuclease of toxin-antitoxin system